MHKPEIVMVELPRVLRGRTWIRRYTTGWGSLEAEIAGRAIFVKRRSGILGPGLTLTRGELCAVVEFLAAWGHRREECADVYPGNGVAGWPRRYFFQPPGAAPRVYLGDSGLRPGMRLCGDTRPLPPLDPPVRKRVRGGATVAGFAHVADLSQRVPLADGPVVAHVGAVWQRDDIEIEAGRAEIEIRRGDRRRASVVIDAHEAEFLRALVDLTGTRARPRRRRGAGRRAATR